MLDAGGCTCASAKHWKRLEAPLKAPPRLLFTSGATVAGVSPYVDLLLKRVNAPRDPGRFGT
jgi:hypothetical protein